MTASTRYALIRRGRQDRHPRAGALEMAEFGLPTPRGTHAGQPDALWRTAARTVGDMTYLIVIAVVLIIGLVIENARHGPVKATRTGSQAGDGGDGGG